MKKEKKPQKTPKKEKFLKKIAKFNPYRELLRNKEDGKLLEPIWIVYHQKLTKWLIKIFINGFFLWIVLFSLGWKHPLPILAEGIGVWLVFEYITKLAEIIKK